jgi:FAD-dependent oxidoreductase domain-containing protein 1
MVSDTFEVVIIGGGVVGSAIAYFLVSNPDFNGRVMVLERDPSYASASSSLSTSAIRQQFATRPNIAMSQFSIEFLRRSSELLFVAGHTVDVALREPGYLLVGGGPTVQAFEERHQLQTLCGCSVQLLRRTQLATQFPWLNVEDLAIGSYGLSGEGWFDGPALMQAFRRKAKSLGAIYAQGEVAAVEMNSSARIDAVVLSNGQRLVCETAVNAAGANAGRVARLADVDLPVQPRKRCVFVTSSPTRLENMPFILDNSGAFVRPEGHYYICGTTPPAANDPDDFGLDVDHWLFDELIWPALAHRIPAFEELRVVSAWAGLYEYNTFDHSAVIGRHPVIRNFVFANGFSGHGMMHAPATGAGISELLVFGEYRSIDLAPFAFERIAANAPIVEHVY